MKKTPRWAVVTKLVVQSFPFSRLPCDGASFAQGELAVSDYALDERFFALSSLPMKLDDWLIAKVERRSAFAARLGTSAGYVTDLC